MDAGDPVSRTDLLAEWGTADPAVQGEAAVIDAGWALYRRARAGLWYAGLEAADLLEDALDVYEAIHSGHGHPAAYWADLGHDPQPYDAGLRRAAGDALDRIVKLIKQAPALAGDTP